MTKILLTVFHWTTDWLMTIPVLLNSSEEVIAHKLMVPIPDFFIPMAAVIIFLLRPV